VGALWLAKRLHGRMDDRVAAVARGEAPRWPGESLPARSAKYIQPDILAWIVAPAERQLDEARGYLLRLYAHEGWDRYLHPAFPGGLYDRGHQLWLMHCGVCARIDFIPASSEGRLVGKGLDLCWIDEAGFVDNARFQALRPSLMDKKADLLATGTPSLGDDQWFTRLAKSGLEKGHERSDGNVERDPDVSTYIADTATHAALPAAREEAVSLARFMGTRLAAQWLDADWRQRGRHVYDEWSADRHAVYYKLRGAAWWLGRVRLPRPDTVIGSIDWSGGASPGAAVVAHIWRNNPLSDIDPRPLVVQVAEHQGYEQYTDDGWWGILRGMDRRWGVDRWVGDPHGPNLIKEANDAGIWVEAGSAADKPGRIRLVAGLLHWAEGSDDPRTPIAAIAPAMYVSNRCEKTMAAFADYSWQTTRDGHITDKPKQYNDHLLDAIAYIVPEIDVGSVWVGTEAYG